MMTEPKAFASLSAGLLARKGMARPAMRRQGAASLGGQISGAPVGVQDDLGWNDMGFDVNPAASHVAPSMDLKQLLAGSVMAAEDDAMAGDGRDDGAALPEVVRQQAELAKRISSQYGLDNAGNDLQNNQKVNSKKITKRPNTVAAKGGRNAAAQVSTSEALPEVLDVRARDKAAFTLRLDAERHLRLRLASAVRNQSSQAILTQLLDDFLASVPEIGDLAGRVSAVSPARMRVLR